VVAVGAVAVVDGALLLVRRRHPPEPGRWTLPGGKLEPGESVPEAVEREVLEETGLRVHCGALVGWAERRGPGHHFVILDFAVAVDGETVPPLVAAGDADAAAWVDLGAVGAHDLVSGLEDFLRGHGVLAD
jgi:acetyl-CoA carboxylase carboxyl transferase subunit beta